MSHFITFGQMSEGIQGTAPSRFLASTADGFAAITASGYMNDLAKIVKVNDIVEINYSDTTVLPAQVAAIYGKFQVVANGSNLNLQAFGSSNVVGSLRYYDQTVTVAQLNLGGVTVIPANNGQYQVRDVKMNRGGVNFDVGGDRGVQLTDTNFVYTVIPSATLENQTNSVWGSTGCPAPATIAFDQPTILNNPIVISYAGGTTNYASGSMTLTFELQRIA